MKTTQLRTDDVPPAPSTALPQPSGMRRALSFLLRAFLFLLLVLFIALGITFWLLGTNSGFAKLTTLANDKIAGLSIENASGNLRQGVNARQLEFSNESLHVQLSELDTRWSLECLLQGKFCLDHVLIDSIDIDTFATDETIPESVRTEAIILPNIKLPLDVDIHEVQIDTVRLRPSEDAAPQTIENIQLSAQASGSVVTIDTLALSYQNINADLQGSIELQDEYPLELLLRISSEDILPDAIVEGEGAQALLIVSRLSNSLQNLDIAASSSGIADIDVTATVQPLQPELPASLSINSDTLGWPLISQSQVRARDIQINARGDINDYEFTIASDLSGEQIPATQLTVDGSANTQGVTLPDVTMNTLGGVAYASANVKFGDTLNWDTRWNFQDINPALQIDKLDGQLSGQISASGEVRGERWSLKLDEAIIDGELRNLPFHLEGKLNKGLNNIWFVDKLTLNNDDNEIRAHGVVGDTLDIVADIRLPQLQNLLPDLTGDFDANLDVKGSSQNPDINISASADAIKFNDILIRSLSLDGDIAELFKRESSLTIDVESIRVADNTISDTAVSLSGEQSDHRLELSARGPQDSAVALSLNGSVDDKLNWTGLLNNVQASLPLHQVSLASPATIRWQNTTGRTSVSPHCWEISDASRLCLQDEFASDPQGTVRLALQQYPLQQLNQLLPKNTQISGLLAADIDLTWGDDGAQDRSAIVSASINSARVQSKDALGDPVSFDLDTVMLDAELAATHIDARLAMSSSLLGTADLQIQLDPTDKQSAIEGNVTLNGLSLTLAEAFLADVDTIDGTLSANGRLGGTLVKPEYTGRVVLDAPELRADILPLPITGGRITANVAGQRMTLNGEVLSNDGVIGVAGRGFIDPENWNVDVNLTGKELTIQSDPVQQATVNHDIQIVANTRRVSITGDIDIPDAVIDVAELPEGAATVSSDVVILEDIEQSTSDTAVAEEKRPDFNVAMLIEISLGDDVRLSAYGLNANLTGDFDVRVRGDRPPQLGGDIQVVNGIFKKYGQDLEANGQILFVGPIDSTRLAIDAEREIETEDRMAGLRIQGTVAQPEITLYTDPADKSQDAILSYIVLGRDINQASNQEADLLATAALALAVRGSQSVGSGIADKLGVEEFGLETRGSGDSTELVVSGRLNDRVLLRYGRGVFDAQSTLYLRYDLTRQLYLEAAQGAQRAVDLFYSFSF